MTEHPTKVEPPSDDKAAKGRVKDVECEAKRNAELREGARRVMQTLDYGEYVRLAARLWKEGAPLTEISEQTGLEMS
ncbi:MAG: hypothetical protein J3T61_05740 [Candidatus Brocadiales bacterium]|nr:hypothetical protein [Candidatus Bathyanammoxibius sp.]